MHGFAEPLRFPLGPNGAMAFVIPFGKLGHGIHQFVEPGCEQLLLSALAGLGRTILPLRAVQQHLLLELGSANEIGTRVLRDRYRTGDDQ
jgi:hypothetical protein